MKKTVLTFGLISGAIASSLMLLTLPFIDDIGFEHGEVIGYTSMVVAFLLVFFGIRSYRENVAGGSIGFGRAFTVGILITFVSCACYVATWEVIYYKLAPDFVDKYAAYIIDHARASGATEQELTEKRQQMAAFKLWYDMPLVNMAITFLEPLPVGLVMTLISAGLLRKKRDPRAVTAVPAL